MLAYLAAKLGTPSNLVFSFPFFIESWPCLVCLWATDMNIMTVTDKDDIGYSVLIDD